jgi:hypothetical protein
MSICLRMAIRITAQQLRLWIRRGRIEKGRLVRMRSYYSNFIRVSRSQMRVDEDEDVG